MKRTIVALYQRRNIWGVINCTYVEWSDGTVDRWWRHMVGNPRDSVNGYSEWINDGRVPCVDY